MPETRVSDVVVPEIFSQYTLLPSIFRSRLWLSGLIDNNAELAALLNGGGKTFNLPFWNDTAGTSGDVPSETVDVDVNNITAGKQVALRQFREKVWGANDLSAVLAGEDALNSAAARVNDYWGQAWDIIGILMLTGMFEDNIANDGGDLVNDISAGVGSASNLTDAAVIDAQALLGENGILGRSGPNDNVEGDFIAMAVHPAVYAWLRKEDQISFVPISDQPRPIPFYLNMALIIDRNMPLNVDIYDTYLLKSMPLSFGIGSANYMPTEIYRRPERGFGIDELYTRRQFSMHVYGTEWTDASVAGESPTDAELVLAANYNRVVPAENMRAVMIRHKIDQT